MRKVIDLPLFCQRSWIVRINLLALAVLVLVLVLAGAIPSREGKAAPVARAAQVAACFEWRIVDTPNAEGTGNVLTAVSAASATDVWAVGYTSQSSGGSKTLIMHWDGSSWSTISSPNPNTGDNYLDGVVALSARDAWAVGDSGTAENPRTIILHWDGTSWTPARLPQLEESGNALYSISATSPTDIWAVGVAGSKNTYSGSLIMHYNGTDWQVVKSVQTGYQSASILYNVYARSANEVWAVGAYISEFGIRSLLLRFDGANWQIVNNNPDRSPRNMRERYEAWAVTLPPGSNQVLAVGDYTPFDPLNADVPTQALVERFDGQIWTRAQGMLRAGDENHLRGTVAFSGTDAWAVGFGETPERLYPLIGHWDGSQWSLAGNPTLEGGGALNGLAQLPGNGLISVGYKTNGSGPTTLVEVYKDYCAPTPFAPTPTGTAAATPVRVQPAETVQVPGNNSSIFPETGKSAGGIFLDYWEQNGGLSQQGYPISDLVGEVSPLDKKPYTVQYFERAVFEYHPENRAPYNILLSQLGTFRYKKKYPDGAPDQTQNTSSGSMHFSETGHRLGGRFLEYWDKNGGLSQQGYPISDEFQEKSDLDGKLYTVQYFERAVFELHPENQAPYDVLLSQLGTFRYKELYGKK
ncbi:MAG: hypothetical protein ABI670_11820 [Chloroflexota bacterium]